jgi:hypothetical protein
MLITQILAVSPYTHIPPISYLANSPALKPLGPPKRKRTPLPGPPLRNIHVVKIPQMLHQMVAPREALIANAIAARYRTWVIGRAHTVDRGLVAL